MEKLSIIPPKTSIFPTATLTLNLRVTNHLQNFKTSLAVNFAQCPPSLIVVAQLGVSIPRKKLSNALKTSKIPLKTDKKAREFSNPLLESHHAFLFFIMSALFSFLPL